MSYTGVRGAEGVGCRFSCTDEGDMGKKGMNGCGKEGEVGAT
jgi:hypothetical protein